MELVSGGIVIGPDGRILVVSQCGTSWSLPKGHIEPGESLGKAARREIEEESGLTALRELGELITYERSAVAADGSIDESRRKRITLFAYLTQERELCPQDSQNPEARWVHLDDVAGMLTHPADSEQVRRAEPRLVPHVLAAGTGAAVAKIRERWPRVPQSVLDMYQSVVSTSVEELASSARLVLEKPYGVNVIVGDFQNFGISVARLHPGRSSSFHFHRERREFFMVRRGELSASRGETHETVRRFESSTSTPGLPHAIENNGSGDMEIAELFSPFLLDDKIRISDRYERRLGLVDHLA